MKQSNLVRSTLASALVIAGLGSTSVVNAATEAELKARIQQLEAELNKTRKALKKSEAKAAPVAQAEPVDTDMSLDIAGGKLKIGGALRANYTIDGRDPATSGASTRAKEDGGTVHLDTARVNMDYTNGNVVGKFEYRFYSNNGNNGYHMLHTGWLGYNYDNGGQVQVGVNRVPFGPGAYGVSQSWFFDQHYYVGLSDDMDLGVKYIWNDGPWDLAAGFYLQDEGSYKGGSKKADRFSYDAIVDNNGDGYEEAGQANFRAIYNTQIAGAKSALGASFQYGELDGKGVSNANAVNPGANTADGDMYALSLHMVNNWNNYTLATQLTKYKYDVDTAGTVNGNVLRRGELVAGAFAFPTAIAAEATIPAVSVSYKLNTPSIGWLNYVLPFAEYSTMLKDEAGFNNSWLSTVGAAFSTAGGWYTYVEYARSNGNDFIGNVGGFNSRFGSNSVPTNNYRFNINFGYYF